MLSPSEAWLRGVRQAFGADRVTVLLEIPAWISDFIVATPACFTRVAGSMTGHAGNSPVIFANKDASLILCE